MSASRNNILILVQTAIRNKGSKIWIHQLLDQLLCVQYEFSYFVWHRSHPSLSAPLQCLGRCGSRDLAESEVCGPDERQDRFWYGTSPLQWCPDPNFSTTLICARRKAVYKDAAHGYWILRDLMFLLWGERLKSSSACRHLDCYCITALYPE